MSLPRPNLPRPNLDDRNFKDLMEEARSLIPIYNKEWTNHNPSDPGITLLELFAWLSDMMLYRVNLVPEENYRKFIKLIGIEPRASGTGTISSEDQNITGEGTTFAKELKKGDSIIANDQKRIITEVNSDISLTVDLPFDPELPSETKFFYLSAGTGTISNISKTVTGTGTISSEGKKITGEGTSFTKELKRGDSIIVGDQKRIITEVNSDTSLAVDRSFDPKLPFGTKFFYLSPGVTGSGTYFTRELKKGESITVPDRNQTRFITAIISDNSLTVDSPFTPDLSPGTKFVHAYESLDSSVHRVLESISQPYRAITSEDYVFLAKECMDFLQKNLAGRIICVTNRDLEYSRADTKNPQPGHVSVIIIPRCNGSTVYCNGNLPNDNLKRIVKKYLDARKLVTTRVHVIGPYYQEVTMNLEIVLEKNALEATVKEKVKERIKKYFDPLEGGQDERGWQLGRPVYRSEVYQIIEGTTGIDHAVKVSINGSEDNLVIKDYELISIPSDKIFIKVNNE